MAHPFKVHELLKDHPAELEELEAYAREPGRTWDECHQWLLERGYRLSRGAVGNWLSEYRTLLQIEKTSGAAKMANALMETAKQSGGLGIADAAVQQIGQLLFEAAASRSMDDQIDPKDLSTMALSLQRLMLAKGRLEDTRAEMRKQQAVAIEAAEKVVAAGGDGKSVVNKVREILGLEKGAAA